MNYLHIWNLVLQHYIHDMMFLIYKSKTAAKELLFQVSLLYKTQYLHKNLITHFDINLKVTFIVLKNIVIKKRTRIKKSIIIHFKRLEKLPSIVCKWALFTVLALCFDFIRGWYSMINFKFHLMNLMFTSRNCLTYKNYNSKYITKICPFDI